MHASASSLTIRRLHNTLIALVGALLMVSTMLVGTAAGDTIECGTVINQDTTLSSDVGPCPSGGIVVAADNITLDLGGHTVTGDPQARPTGELGPHGRDRAGILLQQVTGVTVTNGNVTGFDAGVAIMGGSDNTIRRVTAQDNINYRLVTGEDARPQDVDPEDGPFCWFGDGITVFNSSDNVFEHNALVGNGPFSGISLVGDSDDNLVSRNDVLRNELLNETPDGEPTICGGLGQDAQPMTTGRHVQDIGVRIEGPGAQHNVVEQNRIRRSGLMGIMVHGNDTRFAPANSHNMLRKNHISGTATIGHTLDRQGHGIYLHQPGPAFVHAPHNTTIEGNNSSRNYGGGIFLDSRGTLHSAVVRNNVVNHNGLDGLYVAGAGNPAGPPNELAHNRGHGNGHRADEVNAMGDPRANYFGTDGSDSSDGCEGHNWSRNRFGTVNQACVAAGGTGSVDGPGQSEASPGNALGPLRRGNPYRG